MPTGTTVRRRNGHYAHRTAEVDEANCPYCGQSISKTAYHQIRARIETEERARFAKLEEVFAAKARADIEGARRDAAALAEKIRKEAAVREATIRREVTETLAPKIAQAVNAERQRAHGEKLALEARLADLHRRLQAKPAHLIGEPAEISLHKALVAALPPEDKIERVGRGVKGADFIITVMHGNPGVPAGKIIIDSKAHARWSNKFALKLKSDQREAGASFGILSSTVMPAGCAELHVQDGVIIANPLRVPALVLLLRQQILDSHRLALTTADRDEKADRLLSYIGSRDCADLLDKIVKLTRDMADLDAKEASSHEAVWRRRADLIRGLQAVNAEFLAEINRIIGGNDPEASP